MINEVEVKLDVRNGGYGIYSSKGIVSAQDDNSWFVKDGDSFANDFTITTLVPKDNTYVNIRWSCTLDFLGINKGYAIGKLPLDMNSTSYTTSYTIVLDYSFISGHNDVNEHVQDYQVIDSIGLYDFYSGPGIILYLI